MIFIRCLPQLLRKPFSIIQKKRGTAMPRSELEVLGKPVTRNVGIAAHANI